MKEPTEEQIKRFWEWCGILQGGRVFIGDNPNAKVYNWHYPDGLTTLKLPKLDLNNLFKWAVPKLHYVSLSFQPCWKWNYLAEADGCSFNGQDPTLALFWAIREVMK